VRVITPGQAERFDKVVLATHSDQALALLSAPSAAERNVLGAIRYQPNRAVLHTDNRCCHAPALGLGGVELRARARATQSNRACACTTC
jgi:predicted NAD/FAD-binding protein